MLGLIRGFLGGVIAAATMCGGLRAIARGDKLPTEEIGRLLFNAATRWREGTGSSAQLLNLAGTKGGSAHSCPASSSCPPRGTAHHLAKCPSCGRRWHEHESA